MKHNVRTSKKTSQFPFNAGTPKKNRVHDIITPNYECEQYYEVMIPTMALEESAFGGVSVKKDLDVLVAKTTIQVIPIQKRKQIV